MLTRIITAVVGIGIFVPFCIFSASPAFLFPAFFSLLTLLAAFEILKCTGLHKKVLPSLLCYLTALAAPNLTRILSRDTYFFVMACVYFALIFLMFVVATFSHGRVGVTEAATASMMTVYVSFALSALVLLRDLTANNAAGQPVNVGGKLYLLCFLFAWMPDTGGYFIGKFFGKHRLIPDVSPKKTVEGLLGGIFFAVVTAVAYGFIIGLGSGHGKGFLTLILLAVICSLVSVCGDLLASLVKRHYGIKDYGFLFPGHGGVMDRFDSVIAVAPFLYILSVLAVQVNLLSDFTSLL